MRATVWLLLALGGCAHHPPSAEELYREARSAHRSEQYGAALDLANSAERRAAPDTALYWRVKLLRAEILLEQRQEKPAAAALNFQLPSGGKWAGEWAEYRLCQATLANQTLHPDDANRALDQAETFAKSTGDPNLTARIAFRRAVIGKNEASLRALEANSDALLRMKAAGALGSLLVRADRIEEAIDSFELARDQASRLHAAVSEPRAMLGLGVCFYRLGNLDRALKLYQQAQTQFARAGDLHGQQQCFGQIGNIQTDREDFGAASNAFKQALEIASSLGQDYWRSVWLNNLARVAIATGDWDGAERFNNDAWNLKKALHDPREEAYPMANAGRIAAGNKKYALAEELFRSLYLKARDNPVPFTEAHLGMARLYTAEGREREAESEYRTTEALLESQRTSLKDQENRLTYFATQSQEFYRDYVDYLMERRRPLEALEAAESSRVRTLLDNLKLHATGSPRKAADFQRIAADSGATLLSYWLGAKRSYLWVIQPSGIRHFELPPASSIRKLVESYHAVIQNQRDPLTAENPAGRQLYDLLFAPAAALLPKQAKIILVPDGPLYSLNFETLPVSGDVRHYLIEDATLMVTPSLRLLTPKPAQLAPLRSALLIGDPIPPVKQYPRLEYAQAEMGSIETNLAGMQQTVLSAEHAEPAAYAQAQPGHFDLIHFAAHAAPNAESPLDSAVILSPHGTNYKLRARDVLQTRLTASLVTVSACESAGVSTYAGEGLVGFSWAFLEAGARQVIAGLWAVNDRSTATLMDRLYQGLGRGQTAMEALRNAKLESIRAHRTYAKPYYWGAFELFIRQM